MTNLRFLVWSILGILLLVMAWSWGIVPALGNTFPGVDWKFLPVVEKNTNSSTIYPEMFLSVLFGWLALEFVILTLRCGRLGELAVILIVISVLASVAGPMVGSIPIRVE